MVIRKIKTFIVQARRKRFLIVGVIFLLGTIGIFRNVQGVNTAFTGLLTVIANSTPNRPILNIPAPGATTTLTGIVMEQTATDPNSDNIQFKSIIYQNEACTQVVETHNQNGSQTGWIGQNASASAEYSSGNTGIFTTTSSLTASTIYYWGASAIDPEGSNTFGSSSLTLVSSTWAGTTAFSQPVNDSAGATYNGYLYVIGGATSSAGGVTTSVLFATIKPNGSVGAWSATQALPANAAISQEAAVASQGYLYVLGGSTVSLQTSSVRYIHVNSDGTVGTSTWNTTNALPATFRYHSAAAYNGYVYVVGGRGNGAATTTVFYSPINANGTLGTWQTGSSSLPSALDQNAVLAYNGYLYSVGGEDASANSTTTVLFSQLSTSTGAPGTWQTSSSSLPSVIKYHAAGVYNGYLYTAGGFTITSTVFYAPLNATGSVGTWSRSTALPAAVGEGIGAISNGYFYVMGGSDGTNPSSTVSYAQINTQGSLATEGWTSQSSLAVKVENTAPVIWNGYMYMMAGATADDDVHNTSTVQYSLISSSGTLSAWLKTAAMSSGTQGAQVAAANGALYYMGAGTFSAGKASTNTILYAVPNADGSITNWNTNPTPLPQSLSFAGTTIWNGKIYTVGGADAAGGQTTTVQYATINTDHTLGSWTTNANGLPKKNILEQAVAVNGYLYVAGGDCDGVSCGGAHQTSSVFYAPINPNGSVGAFLNTASLPHILAVNNFGAWNNFLYVYGGNDGSVGTTSLWYAQILPLGIGSGTIGSWIQGTVLPSAIDLVGAGSAAIYNGYLYSVGGRNSNAPTTTVLSIGLYTSCIAFTAQTGANSAPSITSVKLNNNNSLTLTANATTTFNISYHVTDTDGCADVTKGYVGNGTSTAFRTGVKATCAIPNPTTSNQSCYFQIATTNTTSSCSGSNDFDVTSTVDIYYFADSTGDPSSTIPTQHWEAFAMVADSTGASSTATSSDVDVNVLTAVAVTTSSINYSSVTASTNTGATNQIATTTNAGNSSTTLQLFALQTLVLGSNAIATSNQHYATSSFTFGGTEQTLADGAGNAKTATGVFLAIPTSTANVSQATYWGLSVANGQASGLYTGTTVFAPLFATSAGGGSSPITLVQSSTIAGTTSVNLTLPTGTANNDTVVVFAAASTSTPPTGPAGYNRIAIASSTSITTAADAIFVHKWVTGDPTSSLTFSIPTAQSINATAVVYRNVNLTTPTDGTSTKSNGGANICSSTSVTTTAANDMLLMFYHVSGSPHNVTAQSEGTLEASSTGNPPAFSLDFLLGAAGATGDQNITVDGNANSNMGYQVALQPQ